MAEDGHASFSDTSSELSSLAQSPSPPPSFGFSLYPTPPPSSQTSNEGTPNPDYDCAGASWRADDGAPPAKRRRISPKSPPQTVRLDLSQDIDALDADAQKQLDRLVKALHTKRKIVFVVGAGISVAAGIPDFRSSTGLFKSLRAQHNLKSSGKALFDASVYRDEGSTASFHEMVRSLHALTRDAQPTSFHHLLARIASEGRLLRLYTQNVDGIDSSLDQLATQVPLPRRGPWPKTIQLHGGLSKMVCTKCQTLSDFRAELFDGPTPPECGQCLEIDHLRTEVAGKRSHGIGRLRPRMVLYNEHNPDAEAIGAVSQADLKTRPDAIVVVGTSLKIPGVKRLVREMCSVVRGRRDGLTAWINYMEPPGKEVEKSFDLLVRGSCDVVAGAASDRWTEERGELREMSQEELNRIKQINEFQVVLPLPPKPEPGRIDSGIKLTDAAKPAPIPLNLNANSGNKATLKKIPNKKPTTAKAVKGTKATTIKAKASKPRAKPQSGFDGRTRIDSLFKQSKKVTAAKKSSQPQPAPDDYFGLPTPTKEHEQEPHYPTTPSKAPSGPTKNLITPARPLYSPISSPVKTPYIAPPRFPNLNRLGPRPATTYSDA